MLYKLFVYRDRKISLYEIKALMQGFNRINHYTHKTNFMLKKSFFKDLPYVNKVYGSEYALIFYKKLFPSFAIDKKILKRLNKALNKIDFSNNNILRLLIERDLLEMKLKLKAIKSQNFKLKLTSSNL